MLSVSDGSRHPKVGGRMATIVSRWMWWQYKPTNYDRSWTASPGGGLAELEAASDTEDVVQVTVGNVLMRYPTCYIVVCDADNAVNLAVFNQLVTSKELHRFNGFRRSTDASPPPSVPPLGPTQRVEKLNQWIQIRSSPANDLRRPIRIWVRFSITITTHYYPTILY